MIRLEISSVIYVEGVLTVQVERNIVSTRSESTKNSNGSAVRSSRK
jgi:hypothetical protein